MRGDSRATSGKAASPIIGEAAAEVVAGSHAAWSRHLGYPAGDDLRECLAAGSVAEVAHATAQRDAGRPAIQVDGVELTHGELDEQAGRMAGWLACAGLQPGEVVVISSPSSVAFVVAYLGVLRAGATAVLANPGYTEAELDTVIADSGSVLALAAGPGLERLQAAHGRHRRLRDVRSMEDVYRDGLPTSPITEPAAREPRLPAILAYTSGTTGRPKTVPLTDANLLSSMRAVMLAWRWRPDDVLVHAMPLFHQHGLGGIHAALLAGSKTVVRSRFDREDLVATIVRERGSVLFAVPAMYARLAEWEGIDSAHLGSLRLAVSGSAPLSPALAERVAQLVGELPLERYGTTESGLDVSNPYEGPRRPGLVGLPLPGVELVIAGPNGEPLTPGRDGEIVLRGPQVFSGYRGDATANRDAFHRGGWFRTGDLGRIDPADGYLQITGRLRELIISGGMNVYPREVEHALEEHPAIARAAVVGVPSEQWGEEVVAAVVPNAGGVSDRELLEFARMRLAAFKCPKRLVFVDELPQGALGKVLAAEVRKLF